MAALRNDNDEFTPLPESDDDLVNENRRRVKNSIRLDVKTINVEIPKDVHFQNEEQILKVDQVRFARKASEIDRVFMAYISGKGHQFESKGRADKIANYLLEMLADYFGIFDTDAKKVVLYYDNRPKFDRLLDTALETYARKRERAKKRSAAARELKQYNWEVPEERVYDSETNHIETAKNHALLPFVQLNEASNPEKEFVKYLEEYSQWIDWWYKNGDKGKQHYAIAYGKSLFYVDFVIRMKNGHVYLLFQGSDGKIHSVNTKFNPKQLWEFSRDTSSVAFDLLVLSMIVYNVDRAVLRLSNSDDGWKRNLILLNVPVINLEDMNKGREAFNKAINFLTGDNWDIHFIQADSYSYNPTKKVKEYNPQFFEKVALFSGGLDSLIGFIDEASTLSVDKKILLVSHMELGKEHSDQKSILEYCRENNIFSNKYEQVLLNAGLKPHSWNIKTPTESTFRSRSLLFFAAGIYIANKISPQCQLIVPENGTISINIPLDSGRRSSCSTRTTHPTFIKRIQEALYAIGISNSIYNPYRLKSKADMVLECCQDTSKKAILESLVDLSCSCAKRGHNVFWDKSGIEIRNAKIKHCGMCLPCLYRRVALDTIGLDNEALLGTDVLHGIKFNLDNKHQKRNRDFNALLYFLKNRMNERTIRQELFFNGIIEKQELDEYTSLALHSYRQVINWLKKKATNEIQIRAGI